MGIGQNICKILCDRIANGSIRNKLPSQSQLMREFHVSSGTVKLVLERLKEQHVIYGVHGKGTYILPDFRDENERNGKIIFVRLTVELLNHPFYVAFLTALELRLAAYGLHLEFKVQPLHNLSKNPVIFIESRISDGEMIQMEHNSDSLKALAINCSLPGCASIMCDNKLGGFSVMEALYNHGHRQIGIIAKDLSIKNCFFEDRLTGALNFAKEHPDLKTAVTDMEEKDTSVGVSSIEDAVHQLYKQLPKLTAVFAFTDTFAMNYLYRFRKNEAVVGYGNSLFCALQHPALASVDEQPELLAQKTAEQILHIYQGKKVQGKTFIPSVLVERASLTTYQNRRKK